MDLKPVKLEDLGAGAIPELFDWEFPRILESIQDPNTDAKKTRKLEIILEFKPDPSRETAAVKVSVKTTIPGIEPVVSSIFLTREGGKCCAYLREKGQTNLDLQRPEPVPIAAGKKEVTP